VRRKVQNKQTARTAKSMPAGLITTKIGMSRIFLSGGEAVPVTYLRAQPNTVIRLKTQEKDGYNAVVLGVGERRKKTRNGKEHMTYVAEREWKVDSLEGYQAGTQITAETIPAESLVTVTGVSKGKGFQGVMKRYGFKGGPASHGSHFHREPGSIGMRAHPGRVLKGHRMAGHMGKDTVTLRKRPVIALDAEKGILAIKGPIPGPNGSTVYLTLESSSSAA